MKLRTMVGALLTCGDSVLLMHRGRHKALAPGLWSCVGGHMEPGELHDPAATCYREIEEETGIGREAIRGLRLRYITVRNTGEEIRMAYYYTGGLGHMHPLPPCEEGTLHWVPLGNIAALPMSFSVKQVALHWLSNREAEAVMLCGINRESTGVTWSAL